MAELNGFRGHHETDRENDRDPLEARYAEETSHANGDQGDPAMNPEIRFASPDRGDSFSGELKTAGETVNGKGLVPWGTNVRSAEFFEIFLQRILPSPIFVSG